MNQTPRSGGQLLIECLEHQGVDRVFCVPGESYLAVLDALFDSHIDVVVARQEGGAAKMAEADGKVTGRPGICFVTRGPGATNAASGIHIAHQDSTPLIMFVGQVGRHMVGRDAFQEVDYRKTFSDLAKWVEQIDQAERIPEVISHAYHVAMSGRPGPVVIALPEDMLQDIVATKPAPKVVVADPAPSADSMAQLAEMVSLSSRPIVIAGGSRWDAESVDLLHQWAEAWELPVAVSFRRQQLFDHLHPHYAGDIGLGINPALADAVKHSDLIILLGGRFSENPSQNFTLLDIPVPSQPLVHIHPGPEELGRIYQPTLPINATPGAFLKMAVADPQFGLLKDTPAAQSRCEHRISCHESYLNWSANPGSTPGLVQMGEIMLHLRESLKEDAIFTNGAGNYATWVHRYHRFRTYGSQVAPTSGSMGYGLPAAIAAKLRHPEREVFCFAGDGCFQMTGQELGTAAQFNAGVIVLVIDNGAYGTIRMHQERHFPHRISATELLNPNFSALAQAYGAHGETVSRTEDFMPALTRARQFTQQAHKPALIHLITDVEAITPTTTISALREAKTIS